MPQLGYADGHRLVSMAFRDWPRYLRVMVWHSFYEEQWRPRKADRPRCGARTRKGTPCRAPAVHDGRRCRIHGGLSTGPRTDVGRAVIAASNRRRARNKVA